MRRLSTLQFALLSIASHPALSRAPRAIRRTDGRARADDLSPHNDTLMSVGLGAFHTGIEVYNVEYSFSDAGISESTPKVAGDAKFRESILLGTVRSKGEVGSAVSRLRDDFAPGTYDVVRRNCNNFATQLAFALVQAQIPGWVNRLAAIGACCRCLVPGPLGGAGGAPASGGAPRAGAVQPYSGRGFSLADGPAVS